MDEVGFERWPGQPVTVVGRGFQIELENADEVPYPEWPDERVSRRRHAGRGFTMSHRATNGLSTGTALFTVGAILYFAVTASVQGFDVNAAGSILMIVGVVVVMVSLLFGMTDDLRAPSHVVESRTVDERPIH